MNQSLLAAANRRIPQPLAQRSIDSIRAPGHIGVARHHTAVTAPGDVTLVDHFAPGHRKLVSNASDGLVRIVGANTSNVDLAQGAWAMFENTGDGWRIVYDGDGATRIKKRRRGDYDAEA